MVGSCTFLLALSQSCVYYSTRGVAPLSALLLWLQRPCVREGRTTSLEDKLGFLRMYFLCLKTISSRNESTATRCALNVQYVSYTILSRREWTVDLLPLENMLHMVAA